MYVAAKAKNTENNSFLACIAKRKSHGLIAKNNWPNSDVLESKIFLII